MTLTRDTAKDIIWDALRDLGSKANIPLTFKANNGDIVLPNGSKIILRGCEDRRQAEKLRGPKYPLVVIDEAQGIPSYLREIIYEIVEPALLDYADGQVCLTGTPNAACSGVFYDAVHNEGQMQGWEVHGWTMRENRSFAAKGIDVEAQIEEMRTRRNLEKTDPAFLREWWGKWVRDNESTVYKYKPSINDITFSEWKELEESVEDWEYVMGLDLGWNDPSAFTVAASSEKAGRFVVVDSYQESEMSNDALARKIGEFFASYGDMNIIADSGGYGKSICEELSRVYGLPIIPAEKTKKATYIEFCNGDLRAGGIKFVQPHVGELTETLALLQWDEKSLLRGIPKEDRKNQNHLSDALLYSWRHSGHQDGQWDPNEPDWGSLEWFQLEAERREQVALEKMERENSEDPMEMMEEYLDSIR